MSNPYQSPDHQSEEQSGRKRPGWINVVLGLSLLGLGMVIFLGLFTARTVQVMGPAPTTTPVQQSSGPEPTVELQQRAEAEDDNEAGGELP
ncbi:MAG: hypothetical protein NXI04_27025 [Planctomycetaceae bacterium]|nr:hypothetical protein [Planctomycetaceae bacterium]